MSDTDCASRRSYTTDGVEFKKLFSQSAWDNFFIGIGFGLLVWCVHSPILSKFGYHPGETAGSCNVIGSCVFALVLAHRLSRPELMLQRFIASLVIAGGASLLTTSGGLTVNLGPLALALVHVEKLDKVPDVAPFNYMLAYGLLGLVASAILRGIGTAAYVLPDEASSRENASNLGLRSRLSWLLRPKFAPVGLVILMTALGNVVYAVSQHDAQHKDSPHVEVAATPKSTEETNASAREHAVVDATPSPPTRTARFMTNGYGTVGPWKGYVFSYVEGGEVTPKCGVDSCVPPWGTEACISGELAAENTLVKHPYPLAMLGWNINQDREDGKPREWRVAGRGLRIEVTNPGRIPLRVQVQDASNTRRWCAVLPSEASFVPWRELNDKCWDGTGSGIVDGTPIAQVSVLAPSGKTDRKFDFCVLNIEWVPDTADQNSSTQSARSSADASSSTPQPKVASPTADAVESGLVRSRPAPTLGPSPSAVLKSNRGAADGSTASARRNTDKGDDNPY